VGETHQVFKGRTSVEPPWKSLQRSVMYDLPVIVSTMQELFNPHVQIGEGTLQNANN
jgi:hypothetical protein